MTTTLSPVPAGVLHGLSLGPVTLRSRAPEHLLPFYRDAVGLDVLATGEHTVLGTGGRALVDIVRRPDAAPAPRHAPGLFHLAIRVSGRSALAARLLALHRFGGRIGASDHLVSEALYADDPDGNGIEIYRDRPRDEWPHAPSGEIAMATLPLDLDRLAREAPAAIGPAPAETVMGHVHLKVADLGAARRFWVDLVGLRIAARYPGALFVSADGYHHHLGLNTWRSADAPPAPDHAAGLDHFAMVVPDAEIAALAGRLDAAGYPFVREGTTLCVADPSGNAVRIAGATMLKG